MKVNMGGGTIGSFLTKNAQNYKDSTAIEYCDCVYTWSKLNRETDTLAKKLLALGVRRGTHLGIWSENSLDYLLVLYAAAKIGAITALINTSYQLEELNWALGLSETEILLIGNGFKETNYAKLCAELMESGAPSHLRHIRTLDSGNTGHFPSLKAGSEATQLELERETALVTPQDDAFFIFTSGTTGRAKCVASTHKAILQNSAILAESMRITHKDKSCIAIPIFHCFCLCSSVLSCLHTGSAVYIPTARSSSEIITAFEKGHCTILNSVPTIFLSILNNPMFSKEKFATLRTGIIGGSLYSPEFYTRLCEQMGFESLLPSLGLTEATAGITISNYDDPIEVKKTTVGHFLPGLEYKIENLTTISNVPTGVTGEICVRGETVMRGYFNQPELSAQVLTEDGWLHTGDIGFLDEAGNLHLSGRKKEIIIRGGENICPSEIENCLKRDERIEFVKVVSAPDEFYGEEICACIVPYDKTSITKEDVQELVGRHLAQYKIPRYVLWFDYFPMLPNGKINLIRLKKQVRERLETSIEQI